MLFSRETTLRRLQYTAPDPDPIPDVILQTPEYMWSYTVRVVGELLQSSSSVSRLSVSDSVRYVVQSE